MDKKNTLLLTVIAVATLLVAVVGATFAYFTAQTGTGAGADVRVTTATTDSLIYSEWAPIAIHATPTNFAQGMESLTGTTGGSVTLTANSEADAEYCYTATLKLVGENLGNDFEYTTAEETPELTLTVTRADNDGTVTIFDEYDVTTLTTDLAIPTTAGGSETVHKIDATAGSTAAHTWNATVTFVNLATDQEANTGKTFAAKFDITTVSCAG